MDKEWSELEKALECRPEHAIREIAQYIIRTEHLPEQFLQRDMWGKLTPALDTRESRLENFKFLHEQLGENNNLHFLSWYSQAFTALSQMEQSYDKVNNSTDESKERITLLDDKEDRIMDWYYGAFQELYARALGLADLESEKLMMEDGLKEHQLLSIEQIVRAYIIGSSTHSKTPSTTIVHYDLENPGTFTLEEGTLKPDVLVTMDLSDNSRGSHEKGEMLGVPGCYAFIEGTEFTADRSFFGEKKEVKEFPAIWNHLIPDHRLLECLIKKTRHLKVEMLWEGQLKKIKGQLRFGTSSFSVPLQFYYGGLHATKYYNDPDKDYDRIGFFTDYEAP